MAQEGRLDNQGRLVIPAAARHALGLGRGEVLSVRVEADHLVLERRAAALARLRERFATVPSIVSLAEELIAERREGHAASMPGHRASVREMPETLASGDTRGADELFAELDAQD